jgi:molybdopterin-guanine dinucleotide biosynthesis protein MobB
VILAGGGATRYGGLPKGLELVGGERIIDRVAAALAPVVDELLLIANDPAARDWLPGVRVAADVRPGEGALGGVHAALTAAGSDIVLVAWDMPFVSSALLEVLRARGERGDADAVLPTSDRSRRGLEPLCAWYGAACLSAVTRALESGDRRVIAFHDAVRTARLPFDEVRRFGDPVMLFANVNTPEERARWSRALEPAAARAVPPMLAIVGKKHAGKTTLTVRLSAELTRRGHRVMTLKHGSHTFNLDPATTDTYRHYHEGNAERVAMASPDKFALVMRWDRELGPEAIAAQHLGDAALVLCEGFKSSALPKVEIFRREAHATPLWQDGPERPGTWRAVVSDAAVPGFAGARFDLAADDWLDALADWVEREFLSPAPT